MDDGDDDSADRKLSNTADVRTSCYDIDNKASVTGQVKIFPMSDVVERISVRPKCLCANDSCVTRWPSGYDAGLAINRSRVRIPASPLSSATLGKLLTHMCLCHQAV